MHKQKQQRIHHASDKAVEVTSTPPRVVVERDIKKELDDLLDEVDAVLEENAEAFVEQYEQKGGQ